MLRRIAAWVLGWAFPRTHCVYCDAFLPRTRKAVEQHVGRDCPNHPLRTAEKRITDLEFALVRIDGRMASLEGCVAEMVTQLEEGVDNGGNTR